MWQIRVAPINRHNAKIPSPSWIRICSWFLLLLAVSAYKNLSRAVKATYEKRIEVPIYFSRHNGSFSYPLCTPHKTSSVLLHTQMAYHAENLLKRSAIQ
ncbi:hypothetical protein Y032_0097g2988 [Ancylostoma ceylanicum]|uniref:Uncharacterized protein n=1 Tax=Ancylostoma ceylanicum TaxID=53326 RepID=A0A016TJN0_9BILA|nr:hypothetical protein Y032_0097g2988 [Ancylostoma ceylanicum]